MRRSFILGLFFCALAGSASCEGLTQLQARLWGVDRSGPVEQLRLLWEGPRTPVRSELSEMTLMSLSIDADGSVSPRRDLSASPRRMRAIARPPARAGQPWSFAVSGAPEGQQFLLPIGQLEEVVSSTPHVINIPARWPSSSQESLSGPDPLGAPEGSPTHWVEIVIDQAAPLQGASR